MALALLFVDSIVMASSIVAREWTWQTFRCLILSTSATRVTIDAFVLSSITFTSP